MYKVAILGYPIKHSLSPKIHNYWMKKLNIKGEYLLLETPKKKFFNTIKNLQKNNFLGVNLTIPLKEEVLKYKNEKDKIVKTIGAANVLVFSKKKIVAKNTDVYGFKKSIIKLIKKKEKKIAIIIGSGGASRAILYSLIELKYKNIFLYNRSINNAKKMKKDFLKNFSNKIKTQIFCENLKKINLNLKNANILINTTPLGMKNFPNLNINIENLNKNAVIIDLIYNPLETNLIKEANKNNIKNINGLDMLLYQAQKSFYYWFKKNPKITNDLKKILKKEIT
tara:strand:+ start:5884 stop:6726 length:843 start_codon:yes stop_codon:yes gene_type:complete